MLKVRWLMAYNVLQIGDVADFENEPFGKTEHLI